MDTAVVCGRNGGVGGGSGDVSPVGGGLENVLWAGDGLANVLWVGGGSGDQPRAAIRPRRGNVYPWRLEHTPHWEQCMRYTTGPLVILSTRRGTK